MQACRSPLRGEAVSTHRLILSTGGVEVNLLMFNNDYLQPMLDKGL